MSAHEQFAEDLALYALGTLQGEERAALEKHLADCNACRQELAELRGDTALLALSTAGPAPPQRARQRLMSAIQKEPKSRPVIAPAPARKRRGWFGALGWAAAAAMVLVAGWFALQSDHLAQEVGSLKNQLNLEREELDRAKSVVATLTAQNAQVVTVSAPNEPPQPGGKAIYVRDRGSLVFIASNMPTLPPQKAYELWLIPANGSAPIPAGVFKPDSRGFASVVNPPLPANVEAKAFAITMESESGSLTPTMPILMSGGM